MDSCNNLESLAPPCLGRCGPSVRSCNNLKPLQPLAVALKASGNSFISFDGVPKAAADLSLPNRRLLFLFPSLHPFTFTWVSDIHQDCKHRTGGGVANRPTNGHASTRHTPLVPQTLSLL